MNSGSIPLKRCFDFLATSPLKIQTTNAQEIFNHLQFFKNNQFLIVDFRSKDAFDNCHIKDSINVPIEECAPDDLVEFDEHLFINKYCLTKESKCLFKGRKRALVILIAFDEDSPGLISGFPKMFDEANGVDGHQLAPSCDRISLMNAILFQKLLVSERHRDTYLCKSSMKEFATYYPFICADKNSVHLK